MTFEEVLDHAIAMLQRRGRLTYRTLKRQFQLDDEALEDLKAELIDGQRVAVDEDERVLVWIGQTASAPPLASGGTTAPDSRQERAPLSYTPPHLAEKILTSRSALEGERKQVTVLFCDLANSTAMAARLGPEAMHTLLNRFFDLALAEVHRYEGTINQFLGDGFMALFGAPIAHEDHARRAVLAALALQRLLHDHHEELGGPHGVACTCRIGLHSGIVVVGSIGDNLRMDYSAVGDTTNLAARLQQAAEPGTILVSEAVRRLAQGYVRLEALPPLQLKGIPDPVTACKVLGVGRRRSPMAQRGERTLSHFVGRERELAVLEALLAQVEDGQGQVVGVVGEAGVGKSRLLFEFRQRLSGRRVTYLEGRCLSYGRAIPYLPLLDLLRHNCGIADTDDPEAITAKVHDSFQEIGLSLDEWAPYLLHLFGVQAGTARLAGLSPEAIRIRTFELIRQMSLNGSQRQPLIFEVEDLHWIDTTSEACFALLAESLANVPILLLGTYRPGYRPPWIEHSYATQIALRRLMPEDGLAVIRSIVPPERLSDQLAQTILAKAEGNPFFIEELTRAVLEHVESPADLAVPDTIQGVLMARIDRLPEVSKRLLQTASVLGRDFSLRLLQAVWEGPGGIESLLLELKRQEFFYEQIGAVEPTYVFKHVLTQEVAYGSLLTTRRQALHAAAGSALERLHADRLEEVYDRLAYHYANTTDAPKAVTYLTRVAEKAARSYAHTEAVTALQEALEHVERLPAAERDRRLVDLVIRLAHSFYFLGRMQDTLDLLLQQQARIEQLQEPALAGPYYFWLGHTDSYLGDQERAAQSAQRALEEGQRCGDDATMGKAYYVLARRGFWVCQYPQGVEHGLQAIALLERAQEGLWLGQAYWAVGLNYYFMGDFERALEAEGRAHALGEVHGDPRLQTYTDWSSGWILATRGDWEEAIAACQRSLECSRDTFNTAASTGWLGFAYLAKGDLAQAIVGLEASLQQFSQIGYRPILGWFNAWLGEALRLHREYEKAREVATQALQIGREAKNPYTVAYAQRVLGQIAQDRGALSETRTHLSEALDTFTAIQSRFEVGRTHVALAELAHAQGNAEAVATHLRAAHALYTALRAPASVERTEQLAHEYGISLAPESR